MVEPCPISSVNITVTHTDMTESQVLLHFLTPLLSCGMRGHVTTCRGCRKGFLLLTAISPVIDVYWDSVSAGQFLGGCLGGRWKLLFLSGTVANLLVGGVCANVVRE